MNAEENIILDSTALRDLSCFNITKKFNAN